MTYWNYDLAQLDLFLARDEFLELLKDNHTTKEELVEVLDKQTEALDRMMKERFGSYPHPTI